MISLNNLLLDWTLKKISQYKIDLYQTTLEDASKGLYESRLLTLAFLEQEALRRINASQPHLAV